jgi:hypothetical protein
LSRSASCKKRPLSLQLDKFGAVVVKDLATAAAAAAAGEASLSRSASCKKRPLSLQLDKSGAVVVDDLAAAAAAGKKVVGCTIRKADVHPQGDNRPAECLAAVAASERMGVCKAACRAHTFAMTWDVTLQLEPSGKEVEQAAFETIGFHPWPLLHILQCGKHAP